jgi:hypothetical protein
MGKALATRKVATVVGEVTAIRATVSDAQRTDFTAQDVEHYVSTNGAAGKVIRDAGEGIMWSNALMCIGFLRSGLIGQDPKDRTKVADGAVYRTQGDYADALGVRAPALSKLLFLGRAAALHGVKQGSQDFTDLVEIGEGRGGSKDTRAAVRKVINADPTETSHDTLQTLLAAYRAEVKAQSDASDDAVTPRGVGGNADPTADETDDGPRNPASVATVGDGRTAIRTLETVLGGLANRGAWDERDALVDAVLTMVADVRKRDRRPDLDTVAGEVTEVTDETA